MGIISNAINAVRQLDLLSRMCYTINIKRPVRHISNRVSASKIMKKIIITFFSVGLIFFSAVSPASAAAFSAQKMIASAPSEKLDQLEVYSYTIGFKNTGTETWANVGSKMVTIKTTENVRKEHWLASSSWVDKTTVTRASTETVKPGEVGFFTLILQAPKKAKRFENHFALYSGQTKIKGTDFVMPVTVTSKIAAKTKQAIPATPKLAVSKTMKISTVAKAQLMIRSTTSLALMAGNTETVIVGFKNSGDRNWRNAAPSLVTLMLDQASTGEVNFKDGWPSDSTVATLDQELIEAGQIGYFTFKIKAPAEAGSYSLKFQMVLNGDSFIPGGEFTLPVAISAPPPEPIPILAQRPSTPSNIVCATALDNSAAPGDTSTNNEENQAQVGSESGLCSPPHQEPILRVGIASVQGQLGVTSGQPFQVLKDGQIILNVEPNITVFLAFDPIAKQYTFVGPGPILTSPTPFVVKGATEPSLITLITYSLPVAYDTSLNDNIYRGSVLVQWSENDGKLWIINELPMEQYLRGLAESSNGAPMEYQKALAIAARTYALYHYQTNFKHSKRNFHVMATVSDQYYRGYNSELRIPNIGLAAESTKGQVVTYQGQVVVTPYSASTDGTTRLWSEVWGGSDKPWLIKKVVPEDAGRRRFGHGVGLSQLAGQDQAKAGKNYVDILKFFYEGTEVTQWY